MTTLDNLEFTIAKLSCHPGDTLVFKVTGLNHLLATNPDRVQEVQKVLETYTPDGIKLLLLDSDIELCIVRVEDQHGAQQMTSEPKLFCEFCRCVGFFRCLNEKAARVCPNAPTAMYPPDVNPVVIGPPTDQVIRGICSR